MPPKKNVNKPTKPLKSPKEKAPKTQLKKEKPKLKTPSVVKVKIAFRDTPKVASPLKKNAEVPSKVTPKNIPKIDRMNEVAQAQLIKNSAITEEKEIPKEKKNKEVRGKKKKIEETPVDAEESNAVPTKKRKVTTKATKTNEVIKKPKAAPKNPIPPIKKPKENAKLVKNKSVPKSEPKQTKRTYTRKTKVTNKTDDVSSTQLTSPSILEPRPLDSGSPCKENSNHLNSKSAGNDLNNTSRRTSLTSTPSCLSWTKDISGSSTTTCVTVCSNDIVRIDGKLPVVKLNNIGHELKSGVQLTKNDCEHSLSESECTSSSSSSSASSETNTINKSLNLSTSSITLQKSPSPTFTQEVSASAAGADTNFGSSLKQLYSVLKTFDLEITNWIGNSNEDDDNDKFLNMKQFEAEIFKVLKPEYNMLLECQKITRILSDDTEVVDDQVNQEPLAKDDTGFRKPDATVIPNKVPVDNNCENATVESVKRRPSTCFDPNDDDDALSLYAESLTGIESSRISNASFVPCARAFVDEEYVPQPVNREPYKTNDRNYCPTKKIEDFSQNVRTKPVCEKQNADSTSIFKDPEQNCKRLPLVNNTAVNKMTVNSQVDREQTTNDNNHKYSLVTASFRPAPGTRSITLNGACFYHLISKCQRNPCYFTHKNVEVCEVVNTFQRLTEEQFIQEYMLIRKYQCFRQKYGKCFLDECIKRDLPKVAVEMVIDFITRVNNTTNNDSALVVDMVETVLLYLNNMDLSVCEDLLKKDLRRGYMLCDKFMDCMVQTQNFWRFKSVFMNLTNFMVREKRTFSLESTESILERVCIFPFEERMAMVLMSIIENTDVNIFDNPKMDTFEKQLSKFSKDLFDKFVGMKDKVKCCKSVLNNVVETAPCPSQPGLGSSAVLANSEKRYTSPDTTNLDNLNKPVSEPIIKRTINLGRLHMSKFITGSSSSNVSSEDGVQNPNFNKLISNNWHHNPPHYGSIPRFPPRPPLIRPMGTRPMQYGPRFRFNHPRWKRPDHF